MSGKKTVTPLSYMFLTFTLFEKLNFFLFDEERGFYITDTSHWRKL